MLQLRGVAMLADVRVVFDRLERQPGRSCAKTLDLFFLYVHGV